jgi:CDP-4-dehydro-6-deoxyglucose reductase
MSCKVTVRPSGREFTVEGDETILAAALRSGVGLPYGCKNGACGTCKAKGLEGRWVQGPHSASALSRRWASCSCAAAGRRRTW